MIYKNTLKTKNVSLKKLSFNSFKNGINAEYDEFLTPINFSRNTYNFNFINGALKTGLGVENLEIVHSAYYPDLTKVVLPPPNNADVLGSWVYNYYDSASDSYECILVLYCSDGKIYYQVLNSSMKGYFTADAITTITSKPNVLNYRLNSLDSLIFTNKTDGMFVWSYNGYFEHVLDAPNIRNMCLHYERLFATVDGARSEVWFSDDLDPTNWSVSLSEAGFIQMSDERGTLNKVISLHDYVYVFREFGISRITAFAEQTEFNVKQLYLSSTKIYEKTVCACGDVVFYLAQDGIYVFDGLNSTKLNLNMESMIEATENAVACYHNGKYYLALKFNYNDGKKIGSENDDVNDLLKNNTLLEIDVKSGDVSVLRGVNITHLTSINHTLFSRLLLCLKFNGKTTMGQLTNTGTIFGTPTEKYWQSPYSDLGYSQQEKIIKEITFQNNEDFEFTIVSDKETKTFKVNKTKSISKIKPNMRGNKFSFRFSTVQDDAHVSSPQIVFGVL